MSAMQHFIVTATWEPEPCWECPGSTGQSFMFVRAHDGKEAVEVAAAGLAPSPYSRPRFISAVKIALPVPTQAKNPKRISEREISIRAGAYVTVLKAQP